jgi:hypothetical protein
VSGPAGCACSGIGGCRFPSAMTLCPFRMQWSREKKLSFPPDINAITFSDSDIVVGGGVADSFAGAELDGSGGESPKLKIY